MKTRETLFDVEVRESPIDGSGVFAKRAFKKGEQIGIFTGGVPETYDENCDFTVEFWVFDEDENTFVYVIEPTAPFKYLNHGDAANVDITTPVLIALRDVAAGEELTIDYGEEWHADYVDTGAEDSVPLVGDTQGPPSLEDEAVGIAVLARHLAGNGGKAPDSDGDA